MNKKANGTNEKIRNIINELLADFNTHTTKEIKSRCADAGINLTENRYVLNNTLQKLKKEGIIESTGELGVYRLSKEPSKSKPPVINKTSSKIVLDWDNFFLIKPTSSRYDEMKVTVSEKGEMRLNSVLHQKIQSSKIQLFLSNDYKTLILNPCDENAHNFTKAGTCKNKSIVNYFQKLNLKFPISYHVQWDEENQFWKGTLDTPAE